MYLFATCLNLLSAILQIQLVRANTLSAQNGIAAGCSGMGKFVKFQL